MAIETLHDLAGELLYLYRLDIPLGNVEGFGRNDQVTVYMAANRDSVDHPVYLKDNRDVNKGRSARDQAINCIGNFSYGGVREVPPGGEAVSELIRLALTESTPKHKAINGQTSRFPDGALAEFLDEGGNFRRDLLPFNAAQRQQPRVKAGDHFSSLYTQLTGVHGGRGIFQANREELRQKIFDFSTRDQALARRAHDEIFKHIGAFLNGEKGATLIDAHGSEITKDAKIPSGSLVLTMDFGPNKEYGDQANLYTPNIGGVNRGGVQAKSPYTVSCVLGVMSELGREGIIPHCPINTNDFAEKKRIDPQYPPTTLVGSAGSMGKDMTNRLVSLGFGNLTLCDMKYDLSNIEKLKNGMKRIHFKSGQVGDDGETYQDIPEYCKVVQAEAGRISDAALSNNGRKGLVITMSYGDEIENSNYQQFPPAGSVLLLACNKSFPPGEKGVAIARTLQERGIYAVGGQAQTLGGAGGVRAEVCHRAENQITYNNADRKPPCSKRAVHEASFWLGAGVAKEVNVMIKKSRESGDDITPYEAFSQLAGTEFMLHDRPIPSAEVYEPRITERPRDKWPSQAGRASL
ncbi:MAG TPA: hypothetical protein VFV38_43240 [Ktedonobacteraceae bacterium]|nr:hypothetical protein [Ktedonobacteraceae bacterium]